MLPTPQPHLSAEQLKEVMDELTFLYAQIKGEIVKPAGSKTSTTIAIHLYSGLIAEWSKKTTEKIETILGEQSKNYSN